MNGFSPNNLAHTLSCHWLDGSVTPVEEGFTSQWRTLPYAVVFQFRGGSGKMSLAAQTLDLSAGSGVFIAPHTPHLIDVHSKGVSYWCHFNLMLFGVINIFTLLDIPSLIPPGTAKEVGNLCESLSTLKSEATNPFRIAMEKQALICRLAAVILSHAHEKPRTGYRWNELTRILPVLQYMQDHLSDPIGRDQLARLMHLSPQQFHRVFHTILGEAPMTYFNRLRIEHACRLLSGTALSVAEIGQAIGYADPFQFSHFFKAKQGVSPKNYRITSTQALRFS